jgi:hypothetical protein
MVRGIHELPKVSPGPAMPDPSTLLCQGEQPAAIFYPLGYPTPSRAWLFYYFAGKLTDFEPQ